jgi:hypothetical protein
MKTKISVLLLSLTVFFARAQSADQMKPTDAACAVIIPDFFEPNAVNGKILDLETAGVQYFEMKIFNCWGVKLFESDIQASVKTGMQSIERKQISVALNHRDALKFNQDLENGTYFFTLNTFCLDGQMKAQEGNIQLIRTVHR